MAKAISALTDTCDVCDSVGDATDTAYGHVCQDCFAARAAENQPVEIPAPVTAAATGEVFVPTWEALAYRLGEDHGRALAYLTTHPAGTDAHSRYSGKMAAIETDTMPVFAGFRNRAAGSEHFPAHDPVLWALFDAASAAECAIWEVLYRANPGSE